MPGMVLIHNPHAKRLLKDPKKIAQYAYLLGHAGISFCTFTLEELRTALCQAKAMGADIIASNGGDGTNHVILTEAIKVYARAPLPNFAFLRGGTQNTIANSLGIHGTTERILHSIVLKYSQGKPLNTVKCNTLKVDNSYGFLFGMGMAADFLKDYYDQKFLSPFYALWKILKNIFGGFFNTRSFRRRFHALHAKLYSGDELLIERNFNIIFCATVSNVGLGFKPFFRCNDLMPGFHLLCLNEIPISRIIPELPMAFWCRPLHPEKFFEMTTSRVEIDVGGPFTYTIDGDMLGCKTGVLAISAGPVIDVIVE